MKPITCMALILLIFLVLPFTYGGCGGGGGSSSTQTINSLPHISPEEAGYSSEKLEDVKQLAKESGYAAVMALYDGKVFFSWGNVAKNYWCHSIRKPFLSALYGLHAARGNLNLDATLDELHIDHIRDNMGMSLSGGERRRVEIARALATEPQFILLDEPFAGVDPISIIDIQNIINQLTEKNIGVLITDHNVRETLGVCERAYIMSEGEVLAAGTPEEILENQEVKNVYLGKDFRL